MLCRIEPGDLFGRRHAKADQEVDEFEDHKRTTCSEHNRDSNAGELIYDLLRVAFEQADRQRSSGSVLEDRVYQTRGKDACRNCAYRPADTVNSKDVQRVVVTEQFLHLDDHHITS